MGANNMYQKKFHRFRCVIVILALVALLLTGWVQKRDRTAAASGAYDTYIIKTGDTLWGIAKHYAGQGNDPRELIYDIEKLNNVKPEELMPGQELKIPLRGY